MRPEYEGMNQSQRAMLAAKTARPGYSATQMAEAAEVDKKLLSTARTVLRRSPELADKVIAGELSVSTAYTRVKATREPRAPSTDRASSSIEDIVLSIDPGHVLGDSDRADLAERMHALYQDEAKLLREVADRITETSERRQKLVHASIDRIKTMSLDELERLVNDTDE